MSVPLLFGRYYLTVLVGKDRRGAERRRAERQKHPVTTIGNLAALSVLAVAVFFCTYGLLQAAGVLMLEWTGALH